VLLLLLLLLLLPLLFLLLLLLSCRSFHSGAGDAWTGAYAFFFAKVRDYSSAEELCGPRVAISLTMLRSSNPGPAPTPSSSPRYICDDLLKDPAVDSCCSHLLRQGPFDAGTPHIQGSPARSAHGGRQQGSRAAAR